jgi:hypothetical protein
MTDNVDDLPPEPWIEFCTSISRACNRYQRTSGDPKAPERIVGLFIDMTSRALVGLNYEREFAKEFVAEIFQTAWGEHYDAFQKAMRSKR